MCLSVLLDTSLLLEHGARYATSVVIQYSTEQYSTVKYSTVSTVQHSTLPFCGVIKHSQALTFLYMGTGV